MRAIFSLWPFAGPTDKQRRVIFICVFAHARISYELCTFRLSGAHLAFRLNPFAIASALNLQNFMLHLMFGLIYCLVSASNQNGIKSE